MGNNINPTNENSEMSSPSVPSTPSTPPGSRSNIIKILIVLDIIILAAIIWYISTRPGGSDTRPVDTGSNTPVVNSETPTSSNEDPEISDWQTYRNDEYGFEFDYPEFLEEMDKAYPYEIIRLIGENGGIVIDLKDGDIDDLDLRNHFDRTPPDDIQVGDRGGYGQGFGDAGALAVSNYVQLNENEYLVINFVAGEDSWPPFFDKEGGGIMDEILGTFEFFDAHDISNWQIYRNDEYGFELTLVDGWEGYSIINEQWSGENIGETNRGKEYNGPEIIIRHPRYSENETWQDIPIMIFDHSQWALIESNDLNVSTAPVQPYELSRNSSYVFAARPRWVGFYDALGQEEAVEIINTVTGFDL